MGESCDVVVIGLGPGGEEVAGSLAEHGLDVVGIEAELVGGECPYWGCVPSKMIIRAADLIAETRRVPGVAGQSTVRPDWTPVMRRIRDQATDNWNDQVAVDRFTGKGGRFVRGRGRITGPRQVEVEGTTYSAARGVVVATGTAPVIPPLPGLDSVGYWTNREAIATETAPASLLVLGGGAIGLELAQAFARFGTEVTVVEALERLIAMEEPEAGDEIAALLAGEGITVRTATRAASVAVDGADIVLGLEGGGELRAERLLVSVGRRPRLGDLGLDTVGLDPKARALEVDEWMRAADGLWGVGDVTGRGAFTHMAMYQARIATGDILGRRTHPAEYHAVPRVTFTDPEVGAVGLTEAQARERGLSVRTGSTRVSSSARGWIHGPGNAGFLKLVEDGDRGILVGATSMGPWGGEVLSMLAVAVHAQIPVQRLREMIYAYPTFHRGVEDALRDLATG
jgi:pyruvate/2-oxoglutarate dehydrogenase complex dihydrolipoamide dehydrogenase (E3) component